jgi:hypothetical protein
MNGYFVEQADQPMRRPVGRRATATQQGRPACVTIVSARAATGTPLTQMVVVLPRVTAARWVHVHRFMVPPLKLSPHCEETTLGEPPYCYAASEDAARGTLPTRSCAELGA